MVESTQGDVLGVSQDSAFYQQFRPRKSIFLKLDPILFSAKVKKFNKFDWKQERQLVITKELIANCKDKSKNLSK